MPLYGYFSDPINTKLGDIVSASMRNYTKMHLTVLTCGDTRCRRKLIPSVHCKAEKCLNILSVATTK